MATDLVAGAVGSLISKVGELLNEEYKLQKGVTEKIGSLIKELECAHAALKKVAEVPPDQLEEQVRTWAREVREASYDMEDILDTFLVSAQGDPEQTDHQSLLERLKKKMADVYDKVVSGPLKRRKIAVTIDDINKRLQEVTKRHRRYTIDGFVSKPSPTSTVDPRLAAMYKEVTDLVGIEKPRAELISMLSPLIGDVESTKKMMKMVSVVGVGGLGKTTLAKAVYDKLKVDFECMAFVPVGRDPDLKKVFKDILIELDKNYINSNMIILDERQLINQLREYLRNKRYFIVIDDIWETKSWETIKLALVQDNCGSRLITTTRKLEVATECGEVYRLQPLGYDESKKLFHTRIFGAEDKYFDTQLDEASDKMIKKCDGVPLAIITMASLLVGKSREEWIEVYCPIVFGDKKKNQQVSDTEWILSLSYYDLPTHLKTCLLYLSAFPEDYVIDKDRLIRKWVAEGFVHIKEPGTSLFEVGEGYFNELVNRGMIQAEESEMSGIVYGCRLHDMVLDLLRLKSQEENFITISGNTIAEGTSSPSSRVRKLVHQNKTVEQIHQDSTGMDLRHVRTFIACRCDTIIDNVLSFHSFQLLRVLAFENFSNFGSSIRLEHIEKLLHLRYLGLRGMDISKLPEGIGALKLLQTLDLKDTSIEELPSSLGLLTQLICLRAAGAKVPNGVIEKLMSLEELHIFCRDDMVGQFVKDLGKLHELRVLDFTVSNTLDKSMQSDLVESLGYLHKIRHLTLRGWNAFQGEIAFWYRAVLPRPLRCLIVPSFTTLPPCINPSDLPNLTHLDIWMRYLDEQDLKILGALPELRHLELQTESTVTVNTINDGCFHKLRSCSLPYSTTLFVLNENSSISFTIWSNWDDVDAFGSQKGIARAPSIMPNLQLLYFSVDVKALIRNNVNCDKLGLEYLPSLQKVKVHLDCSCAFVDDVEKEEAALRHAIEAHPNRPTLLIKSMGEALTKSRPVDGALATQDVTGGEVMSTSPNE